MTNNVKLFMKSLSPKNFNEISEKILSLIKEPYPSECKYISGYIGYRKIDFKKYTISYIVQDKLVKIVLIDKNN